MVDYIEQLLEVAIGFLWVSDHTFFAKSQIPQANQLTPTAYGHFEPVRPWSAEVDAAGILSVVQNIAVGYSHGNRVVLLPAIRKNDGMPALGRCEKRRYTALEEQRMNQEPFPRALRVPIHLDVVMQFERTLRIVHILDSNVG